MKKLFTVMLVFLSALSLFAGGSSDSAENYPSKPITVIVPFAPGGGSDVLTRSMMDYLELPNNANFVVVNVDGASGYIGAQQAFNSPADGYTILAHNPMDVVSYTLGGVTTQPLYKDLDLICGVADDFNFFATNKATGWKTLDDFVEYVKANPGKVRIGNTGSLNSNTGADIQSSVLSGDLVPLVVISDRRSKALPDTPCTEELGIDVVTTKPRGFYAPNGVDPAKIDILKSAIEKVCMNEEFQERVISLGLEVNYQDGEELQQKIDNWVEELTPVFDDMMNGNV